MPSALSSATPNCCGLRHLGEQDLGVAAELAELVDQGGDAAGDQVVAEVHDERVVGEEVARHQHRVGEAERLRLVDVGDAGAEALAVAHRGADLVAGLADDDADLGDAGGDDRLDAEEQDRLVGHRHELLGGGVGQRTQPRALAAGEDQSLHGSLDTVGRGAAPPGRSAAAGRRDGHGSAVVERAVSGRKVPTFFRLSVK